RRRSGRRAGLLAWLRLRPERPGRQRRVRGRLPVGEVGAEHRLYGQVPGERAQVAPGLARIGSRHPLVELVQGETAGRVGLPERGYHGLPVNIRGANRVIRGHGQFFPSGGSLFHGTASPSTPLFSPSTHCTVSATEADERGVHLDLRWMSRTSGRGGIRSGTECR